MAVFQMVNLISGTPELPKYGVKGVTDTVWRVTLPTTLTVNDTINGPTIPAGTYLTGLWVDVDDLDTGGTPAIAFQVGVAGTPGRFISTGNITARTGGIQAANVIGTVGFTAATNTQIVTTITAAAQTAAQGVMRMRVSYTANP